jgi:hypothetical protein
VKSAGEVVREVFETYETGDEGALLELLDPEIEFSPITTFLGKPNRTYHGHRGIGEWRSELDASQIEFRVRIDEVRESGAVRASWRTPVPTSTPNQRWRRRGSRIRGKIDCGFEDLIATTSW